MDKVYFNPDKGTIEYVEELNSVELEVSKQEIEQMSTKSIRELIKEVIEKIIK